MKFHRDGTLPENGEVFVFGSNLAGIHGAGAAKIAYKKFGAVWGRGVGGPFGQCFAIPTKDNKIQTMPLSDIEAFVQAFVRFTQAQNLYQIQRQWFVTRIGCGLAGYKDEQIAPMFKGAVDCSFAEQWKDYL